MKTSSLVLCTLLLLVLAGLPAAAQTVYTDGPINGNSDAWTFNFGFIQSDSFNVTSGTSTLTGFSFGAWLFSGDTLTSAEITITSFENGGTTYFDQVLSFSMSGCAMNQFGFNVCEESTTFNGPTLHNGTYWVNLQNGVVPSGDPVYWDENEGPSNASNNAGTMPGESFTLLGSQSSTTTSTTTTSVPEPSSLMLFASGILGAAALVRRRFL